MFNKTKPAAKPLRSEEPIPPLPDLPSPTQAKRPATTSAAPQQSASMPSQVPTGKGLSTLSADLTFEGNVSADYVEVRGRIVGGVNGKQIKLLGTAYVDGDITHEQLSIDVGAYFQGRCIQGRRDAAPSAAQPSPPPQTAAPAPAAAPAASSPASGGEDTIQPFQAKTTA